MAAKNTLTTGIAELLILSILNEKDSYGYEICKIIKENSDGLISLSYNTTYAATCKMIDSGLVTEKNALGFISISKIRGGTTTTNYTKLIKICHWALIRFFTV